MTFLGAGFAAPRWSRVHLHPYTNILKTFSFLFSRRWTKWYGGLSDLVGGQRTKAYFLWTETYFTDMDHTSSNIISRDWYVLVRGVMSENIFPATT
jgi:hypothetical protein